MDAAGILHILTMRVGANLVGYYMAFILPHPHYQDSGLMAITDAYYVLPEYLSGGRGMQLFVEAEQSLKKRGVVKAYLSCKIHKDLSELFEGLGWRLTDKSFTKYFGA